MANKKISDGTSATTLGGSEYFEIEQAGGTKKATLTLIATAVKTLMSLIVGPASATNNAIALFDGTTGKLHKDSAVTISTDGTFSANSDGKVPTEKAVKTYTASLIAAADAMVFKGVIDCSANPNYPAADRGDTYRISVAGKIGGASGTNVEAGDLIICLTDGTASGNQATVGSAWSVAQANLDGAVIGPASATDGGIVLFDGTTGKIIKQGTLTQLLDLVGSAAQGDILYRNASAWVRLGAGTSGQFLKTLGTGANPAWDTPSAGSGDVTAASNITDNAIVRGDGGTKGVQQTGVIIGDSDEISGYKANINFQTGTTYSLQASDSGKVIDLNNAGAITVTAVATLPVGFNCTILASGAGQVSVAAGSGATARNASSHTKLRAQWSEATIVVRANSGGSSAEYVLAGDTAA